MKGLYPHTINNLLFSKAKKVDLIIHFNATLHAAVENVTPIKVSLKKIVFLVIPYILQLTVNPRFLDIVTKKKKSAYV